MVEATAACTGATTLNALRRYGEHDEDCGEEPDGHGCTCGFVNAVAEEERRLRALERVAAEEDTR